MNPAAAAAAAAAARHPVSPALPVKTIPFFYDFIYLKKKKTFFHSFVLLRKREKKRMFWQSACVSPWREKCAMCRRARNPAQGRVNTLTLQPH